MPDDGFLSDLKRAREEEYFHKREQALAEETRQRSLREAEKKKLGAMMGISEEHLLADLNARIRGVNEGPDGALYVMTDGMGGKILRLRK